MANNYDLSSCVRCGNCKALCPTYSEDAVEGMGARGRTMLLKKFNEGEIRYSSLFEERIFTCMLCGACNSLCPLGIDVTGEIYKARKTILGFDKKKKLIALGLRYAFEKPSRGFALLRAFDYIRNILPLHKIKTLQILNGIDSGISTAPLRNTTSLLKTSNAKGRVAVFIGCTANYIYPATGMALAVSLNSLGYDVIIPKGETCCGAPLLSMGLEDEARYMAEKNADIFKKLRIDHVISLCPTCVHFIKNEYKRLIGDSIEIAVDASEFFSSQKQSLNPKKSALKIIYHDPCHAIYNLNIRNEPRTILQNLGYSLIEPKERGCCGFAGTFSLLYQRLSQDMLELRVDNYREADMVVTSCPNCVLQLKSRIKDKPVKHIVEIIKEALP
jgi:glycolate oxidase iron-sulfur subunit